MEASNTDLSKMRQEDCDRDNTGFFKLPWPSFREQPELHAFVRVIAEVCTMLF